MKNTHHSEPDDLDRHLRETLDGYAPEAPDRLWSGIEARLPARRRRPVFWWALAGLAAAALLGWLLWENAGVNEPAAEKSADGGRWAVDGWENAPLTRPAPTAPATPAAEPSDPAPVRAKKPIGARTQQTGPDENLVEKINRTPGAAPENAPAPATGENTPPLPGDPKTPFFNALPWLPHPPAPVLSPAARPHVRPAALQPPKPVRPRRLALGLHAAPVLGWPAGAEQAHHGGHLPAFSETAKSPAGGWQAGLSLRYDLSARWRLQTGLWRQSTLLQTQHRATLRLSDGVCLNPYASGPKEYEFQYALHAGGAPTNVTVRIAEVDSFAYMPADEPFTLDMRTTRRGVEWLVPVQVQRVFGQGRWQGFVQGGFAVGFSGKTDLRIDHYTEECLDLCYAAGRAPTVTAVDQRRAATWQYLLAGGVEYRLSPSLGFSFSPTLTGRKGQTALAFQTSLFYRL